MRASSQSSTADARSSFAAVLRQTGADAQVLGTDLFAVADVLDGNGGLRRALTDPSREGEDKAAVVNAVEEARERLDSGEVGYDVRHVQRGDDVAEALMNAAETGEASLIVIGLRRRSPLGKLILGSNAQRILLDAPCHVLAVKPDPA